MTDELSGKKVAVLVANEGIEQVELTEPWKAVEAAVDFIRSFVAAGKPIAAIGHTPWTLVEAGVVSGKQLTSGPSLQTDLRNAGADWTDQEVVQDDATCGCW